MSITLAEAKVHLRYEASDEDALIQSLVDGSRAAIERYIGGPMDADAQMLEQLQIAQRLMVSHWFENREAVAIGQTANEIPLSAEWLMLAYRTPTLR